MRKTLFCIALGVLACVAGCSDQNSNDRAIQMLRAAKAQGKLTMSVSEHPLQIGQSTQFFAGPNVVTTFDGNVDFRDNSIIAEAIKQALREAASSGELLIQPKPNSNTVASGNAQ